MGALFGFTGHPSRDLCTAMMAALRHRSTKDGAPAVHETDRSTIVVLPPPHSHPRAQISPGIHHLRSGCMAVSGLVTGAPDLLATSPREVAFSLSGAFVAAVAEGASIRLIRDATGRRTIYCARLGARWVFAVEPKGIHRLPGFSRILRPGAVAQYLTFSFIPGHQTMLKGLFEVPAGCTAILDPEAAEPRFEAYCRPEAEGFEERSDEAWVERFRRDFGEAVRRLRPDREPVAVFLSGGIDSSIVTAQLKEDDPSATVHSFAIHFGDKYPSERSFARLVAEHLGTEHHEVLVTPKDFIPRLHEGVRFLDEPIGDPVAMPNFELASRVGKEGFRFVFNGEGGDPLFGGPKNLPMMLEHWYGGPRPPDFRERAYLASYRRAYEELDRLLTPEFKNQIDFEEDLVSVLRPFFSGAEQRGHSGGSVRFLDKLLAINIWLKGAHLILPKVERMLGAWGLSPMSPLFDETLLRLTFELPGHLKLHQGIEKVILKRAFEGRLPESIIRRPKSGMRVPVHYWFQKEMRRYGKSLLNRRRVAADGIFVPQRIQQLLDYRTEEGPGRYGLRLWMLMTLQIWMKEVLE